MTGEGPFRIDAEVERRVSCATLETHRHLRDIVSGRIGLNGSGFAAALATITLAEALLTLEPLAFAAALLLAWFAAWFRGREWSTADRAAAFRIAAPTHCGFTREGLVLEGRLGTSLWRYAGIDSMGTVEGWLVLALESGLVVIQAEPGLAAWIEKRAPHLASRRLPDWSRPRRWLLAVAIGYAIAAALGVLALGTGWR